MAAECARRGAQRYPVAGTIVHDAIVCGVGNIVGGDGSDPFTFSRLRDVARAIARARGKRLAAYRWSSRCHEMQPPEWMHDVDYCQGCAVEHLGVVY